MSDVEFEFSLAKYAETDLGVEDLNEECWATTAVAGLQFYAYGEEDEFAPNGIVIPSPGDRLTLIRRPDNAADPRAVDVHWRNSFMLGHLPRSVASQVAPHMDDGRSLRAYVIDPGEGGAWEMRAVLIGPAAAPLNGQRLEARNREILVSIERACAAVWPETSRDDVYGPDAFAAGAPVGREIEFLEISDRFVRVVTPRGPLPTKEQRATAEWFERAVERRRRDAVEAFVPLVELFDDLPEGYDDKPVETMRGMRIPGAWEGVPPWLATKSTWRRRGFQPRKDAKPFALKVGGYDWYELFAFSDLAPVSGRAMKAKQRALARRAVNARWVDDDEVPF